MTTLLRFQDVLYQVVNHGSRGWTLQKVAVGSTKTRNGVTYRLNDNHRWQRLNDAPGQLNLLDQIPLNHHDYMYNHGEEASSEGEKQMNSIKAIQQHHDNQAERNRVWGSKDPLFAEFVQEALDSYGADNIPAAFFGNGAILVSVNGDYASGDKVVGNRSREGYRFQPVKSESVNSIWNLLNALNQTSDDARTHVNQPMQNFFEGVRNSLTPQMSVKSFSEKWDTALQAPKSFVAGDARHPLEDYNASQAATLVFGRAGEEFFKPGSGWSKDEADKILGMPIADIAEYYRDLSVTEGIPLGLRAQYSAMAQEAQESGKSYFLNQ